MKTSLRRCLALVLVVPCALSAQRPDLSTALHWRSIGPLRGGRTRAAAGDPSRPYTFYMAQVNGGVWKTDDAGRTWTPIFDDQPTASVGSIAVAPSDPNIVYVGSGEGLPRPDLSVGDGVYRSPDGGKTWEHMGLRDAQQIPQIATAEKPLRLFYRRAKTPAETTSTLIHPIQTSFMRISGSSARDRGRTQPGPAMAADFSNPSMVVTPGNRSATVFRRPRIR
jgi:hypothetical protein